MLDVRGLTHRYPGGVTALDGVSLQAPPGMFGLLRLLAHVDVAEADFAFAGDLEGRQTAHQAQAMAVRCTSTRRTGRREVAGA